MRRFVSAGMNHVDDIVPSPRTEAAGVTVIVDPVRTQKQNALQAVGAYSRRGTKPRGNGSNLKMVVPLFAPCGREPDGRAGAGWPHAKQTRRRLRGAGADRAPAAASPLYALV